VNNDAARRAMSRTRRPAGRWAVAYAATFGAMVAAGAAQAAEWRLSTAGFGPARIGMTVAEAARALGVTFEGEIEDPSCGYLQPKPAIGDLSVMVANGRVVRFDIGKPGLVTLSGLGVGDSEAHVIDVLGAEAVEVTPHKYTEPEGHYLTIWSADRRRAVRFETDFGKVIGFYAGADPQVTYVEGCL